jgi:thymidylate kinase
MTEPLIQRRRITIFEGPDGGGKSTAAQRLADYTDARLVHMGPFPAVSKGLGRMYVEAMLPALLGYQDVVLDRSWMSEPIYGAVFRNGADRLGPVPTRMLERLAMRCMTRVVVCLPPLETCLKNFRDRKARGGEYLDDDTQLKRVYSLYDRKCMARSLSKTFDLTSLPVIRHDYEDEEMTMFGRAMAPHPINSRSAGNLEAPIVLVGDSFGHHKDQDSLFQAPFMSFSRAGCSAWLTKKLDELEISERDLLWVNSDDPWLDDVIHTYHRKSIYALGQVALMRLKDRVPYNIIQVRHPQHVKRFNNKGVYELLTQLDAEFTKD